MKTYHSDELGEVTVPDAERKEGMTTQKVRFGELPSSLNVGDIWCLNDQIVVVVSIEPAKWTGEDIDVYAHVDTWFTVRPATDSECAKWERAKRANAAKQKQRKQLNAANFRFDGECLLPPANLMQRLDSYDDRWEPPASITLTSEQRAIEQEYCDARTDLKAQENE